MWQSLHWGHTVEGKAYHLLGDGWSGLAPPRWAQTGSPGGRDGQKQEHQGCQGPLREAAMKSESPPLVAVGLEGIGNIDLKGRWRY